MKVFIPSGSGIGAREVFALRRLSAPALRVVAGGLRHPAYRARILRILSSPDPERSIVALVARQVVARSAIPMLPSDLGAITDIQIVDRYEQLRKERAAINKVAAQALKEAKKAKDKEAIAAAKEGLKEAKQTFEREKLSKAEKQEFRGEFGPAAEGRHWEFYKDTRTGETIATQAKTMKSGNFFSKAGRALKPFVPVLIGIAGAVLAIPTGGASLALAAVASAGYSYNQKRIQVNKAKRQNRAVSKQVNDQVKSEEIALKKQLDDVYVQHPDIFTAAGITSGQWSSMSTQQRLAVIERINSGQMPSSQANATAAADAQGTTAPTQGQTWQQAIQSSPIMDQWGQEAGDTDTQTAGIQTPTGTYDVYVEGQKVGTGQTLDEASGILSSNSKAGDRVEMLLNGKSLGLKIVTAGGGVISVPDDLAAQVRAASRADVDGIIKRATQSAAPTSSGSGGGVLIALLLAGGAVAVASGGHKR